MLRSDTHIDLHVDIPPTTKAPKCTPSQVLAAIAVSLCDMTIGFGSAYTSTALPTMTEESNSIIVVLPGSSEASWIGSLLPLGALVGGLVGGSLVENFGRKTTILLTAFPSILSWLLIVFAQNLLMVYCARAIAGFSIGIVSLSLPVYLAETLQPKIRGVLGLLPTCFGNAGILLCFCAGKYLSWNQLATLGACLSVPFVILTFFIPETPRWYISKEQEEPAKKALQWLRGHDADISAELNEIKKTYAVSKSESSNFTNIFSKSFRRPMITSLGLMFFQQFSGIDAVIFYTVYIFQLSHSSIDSNWSTIIVGCVNFGAIFIASLLIDRVGRKALLVFSDVMMIFCLGVLGGIFYLQENNPEAVEGLGWIPLVSFMLYVITFSLGFGPIPWLMMGEIFPGSIRGSAASIATAFNWSCAFTVTKVFPQFIAYCGAHVTFFSLAGICAVGFFFILFIVPETKGRSLDDIERDFKRKSGKRISFRANFKPSPMGI